MFTKVEARSPAGDIVALVRGSSLAFLVFADHWPAERARIERRLGALPISDDAGRGFAREVRDRLVAYVAGDVAALDELPVDVAGTDFQMRVWKALRTIPPGETISYQELARRAGAPRAVRAVGNANGKNPVSLAIPCHRVIHADGSIGGYGGGVPRKAWLLEHEKKHAAARAPRVAYA
jgi:methylated-DNA-[protein]-cysteine S-methyltransferase